MLGTVDLVLWMGDDEPDCSRPTLWLRGRFDEFGPDPARDLAVSAWLADSVDLLWDRVVEALADQTGPTESYLLQEAQRSILADATREIRLAMDARDPLVQAEHLRLAGSRLAALVGVDHTEAMLDALFSRFCVGK
jgi:tRNA modification GTPase